MRQYYNKALTLCLSKRIGRKLRERKERGRERKGMEGGVLGFSLVCFRNGN